MPSINFVIVEADSAYNNETESGIVVNTSIEDVSRINRIAKVIEAPEFTILEKGDEIIVHHNIFRLRNDMKGEVVQSNFFLEENKYFVPLTEIFMYRRKGGDWNAIAPYCFVKPIKKEKVEKIGSVFLPQLEDKTTHKGMIKNTGIMSYPNDSLSELGVKKGDKIIFSKNSEYEFDIEGELYYKMSTKDIIGLVNEGS